MKALYAVIKVKLPQNCLYQQNGATQQVIVDGKPKKLLRQPTVLPFKKICTDLIFNKA
jgi:hypothetical protein